jgi:hypothetical protein
MERWKTPEYIDNLDLDDLFKHATMVKSLYEEEAKARQQAAPSGSGRRVVSADAFMS